MKSPKLFIIGNNAKVVFGGQKPVFFLNEVYDLQKRLENAEYRPSKNGKFNINSTIYVRDLNLGIYENQYPEKFCRCRVGHYCVSSITRDDNKSAPEFRQHKKQVPYSRFENFLPKPIEVIE